MTASEALNITNGNNYRAEAIQYGIEELEEKIKRTASKGYRQCIVSFYSFPYGFTEFLKKHGEERKKEFKEYNIETELREYFTRNGFKFKRITDDICGGVRQDPYWVICW